MELTRHREHGRRWCRSPRWVAVGTVLVVVCCRCDGRVVAGRCDGALTAVMLLIVATLLLLPLLPYAVQQRICLILSAQLAVIVVVVFIVVVVVVVVLIHVPLLAVVDELLLDIGLSLEDALVGVEQLLGAHLVLTVQPM